MIGQNVRLVRLLGHGGMGSVWVGEHLTLHIEVAVKFMAAEIARDPPAVARFTREATAAAQIKSPHVVQTFDHGVTPDGYPYIVMELLEGEDLSKRLEREGALGPNDVAGIVSQVCKALSRAHAAGIVHRDIKPDNIFLTEQDGDLFVKVLDFGIAKKTEEVGFGMTSTGTMVGTPYYMSPEQVMSAKDVDRRSDLWSLGVVTYHALTGRVPFVAETLGGLCVAIERGSFTPPSQLNPAVPPAFDAWFLRALARDAAQRFQLAKEMADALQPVLHAHVGFGVSQIATHSSAGLMKPALSDSGESRQSDSGVSKEGDGRTSRPSDGGALQPAAGLVGGTPGAPGSVPVRTLLDATVTGRKRPSRELLVLGLAGGGLVALVVLVVIVIAISKPSSSETAASATPATSGAPPPAEVLPTPANVAPLVEPPKPAEPAPPPSASVASEPESSSRAEPRTSPAEARASRAARNPRQAPRSTRASAKSEPTQSSSTPPAKDRGF